MKQLLLVAFYFPPLGGAGTQRPAKLVKLAQTFGWKPWVVSVRPPRNLVQDESLLSDIPAGTPVRRVFAPSCSYLLEPLRWVGLSMLAKWGSDMIPVDPDLLFWPMARKAAVSLIEEHGLPEAVWTTSAPFSSHYVGLDLQAQYGLPWVADLRDPWTSNIHLSRFDDSTWAKRWRKNQDKKVEEKIYQKADLITVTSSALREHLIEEFGVSGERVLLVRNGFDESDFQNYVQDKLETLSQPSEQPSPFRFLYAGTIYGNYDIQGFIESLEHYLEHNDTPCEFRVFSKSDGRFEDVLKRFPRVQKITTLSGYISHSDLMQEYEDCHAVVVRCPQRLAVAGKLYELLRAKRPIFALSKDGMELSQIVQECGAGICVDPHDVDSGVRGIERLIQQRQEGVVLPKYDAKCVQSYSRSAQYRHLFDALDGLTTNAGT